MTDATLRQLYEAHQGKVSDKWTIYLEEYDRLLRPYRQQPVRLLEIGIQNGGSLEIWSKFFPQARRLVGCDINPDCAKLQYDDARIAVVVGDANQDHTAAQIASISETFDLIIDDGSHTSSDIVRSFCRYFERLTDGGIFIAEDLHCSYWQSFGGGVFDPASSISFFKRLADILNHQHWGVDTARRDIFRTFMRKYGGNLTEELLAHVHSVEFINSMCVVRKAVPAENGLGYRFIAGTEEVVLPGHLNLRFSAPAFVDERQNPWSGNKLLPEEEAESTSAALRIALDHVDQLEREARAHSDRITRLEDESISLRSEVRVQAQRNVDAENRAGTFQAQIDAYERQKEEIFASTSWRVTRPVRWVGRHILRLRRLMRILPIVLERHDGVLGAATRAARVYKSSGLVGLRRAAAGIEGALAAGVAPIDADLYREWIARYDTLDDAVRNQMRRRIAAMRSQPLISIVMPTYNANPAWLRAAIESVRNQIYPNWELCIADDASPSRETRAVLSSYSDDARIKVTFRPKNGHIVEASNSALELAEGEWIALMDHDDLLSEHALFWIADCIDLHPEVRLIYSDEDKVDTEGKRSDPYFKCDWNIDLFYSHNMFSHLGVFHAQLVREVGGFQRGMQGSQDWDLVLRCSERIHASQIVHVPRVLYHWRIHAESTAQSADAKPYAAIAGERALNEHFKRKGVDATVEYIGSGYRVHYALPLEAPLVSIIIPTRNCLELLRQCIDSIVGKTTYRNYEVVVVDNGSDDIDALEYLEKLRGLPNVKVIRDENEFNYSAINNRAVAQVEGVFVALVNNDIEVATPDWLSEMVSLALQPGVGAVGAKLWYPNKTLQHGGVVLGIGGVASHAHKLVPQGNLGYFGRANLIQSFSAVTAACMVVRKELYERVGGLDDANLKVAYNDVDFCLRLRAAGFRNVWTPYAELIHHESASRGSDLTPERQVRLAAERSFMLERWGALLQNDPAYSPNLTLNGDDFSYAWPPRTDGISDRADEIELRA